MTRPGFEPGPPRWEACDYRLSYGAACIRHFKLDMICFAKPGLMEDLCIVGKEEFSI
jgi:hypothetical protein